LRCYLFLLNKSFIHFGRLKMQPTNRRNTLEASRFLISVYSLVSLALAEGLVLGLAGVPQEEGDSQGGESHHSEREPIQLQ